MREFLFHLDRSEQISLQAQLRQMIVAAILDGQLPPGDPLPSCRRLAGMLGVARNTVMLAYQSLVDEGFLEARERSGYYVAGDVMAGRAAPPAAGERPAVIGGADWPARFRQRPSGQRNIVKPKDWQKYPFPFITGQVDPALFPIAAWRDCSRQALGKAAVNEWSVDRVNEDDPILVQQLRTRALPRRGVRAAPDEILVTIGAQHALYLLASLLVRSDTRVGFEDPGYPDARNIFQMKAENVASLPIDADGLILGEQVDRCGYVYVTPSHQYPTTVTMPLARRRSLLERAERHDFVIIEDDYESESNYLGNPTPALKSLDTNGRVIYVGSLSKVLAPGLRLGYVVGPAALIAELRSLRRLMMRHPPANNQRTVALFFANGHYDALLRRLHQSYYERWQAMGRALHAHLPKTFETPTYGGTSFWVRGPEGLDARELSARALERGIVLEPGDICFAGANPALNHFRLGFSSIPLKRIEPGIELLAELIHAQADIPGLSRGAA